MKPKLFPGVAALLLAFAAPAQEPVGRLWEFPTSQNIQSSPAVGPDGGIYFGSDDGKLYAVNPDGTPKWVFAAAGNIISAPAIGPDGVIYVGSVDRNLYAVFPDGKEKWHFTAASGIVSSPALGADGTIYVGTVFNVLLAIRPDGGRKWEFQTGGNVIASPAVAADGTIYVGAFNGKFYALKPDGSRKWDFVAGDKINSSAAIGADGTVYFGSFDNFLYALKPDGSLKWKFGTGGAVRSSPAIGADGTIYVGSDDKKLYAINPDSSRRWAFASGNFIRSSPAVAADGTIYFGSYDNFFYAVNPNGSEKWKLQTGFYVSSSPAIATDGTVYFGSWDKTFYAVKGGSPLAASPWPKFRRDAAQAAKAGAQPAAQLAQTEPVPPTAVEPSPAKPMPVPVKPAAGKPVATAKPAATPAMPERTTDRADTTKPTVEITVPLDAARIPNPIFTVRGTASDNVGVTRVEYQLNDGDFELAQGTTNWNARVASVPGIMSFRVRARDLAGNYSTVASHTFNYVVLRPLKVEVDGPGTVQPALGNRILEVGRTYTLTAEPNKDCLFAGWTGGLTNDSAKLTFVMQSNLVIKASFITLPFQPVKGVYHGLFQNPAGTAPDTAGYFTLTVNGQGGYTGALLTAGQSYPLSGQFNAEGGAQNSLVRRGYNPLAVTWKLDLKNNSDQISGTLGDGQFNAALLGDRTVFDVKNRPAPQAGKYTLILPGGTNALASPGGDGFGAVTVDAAGNVRFAGELADGTEITQETALSRDGVWPFYTSLYGGKGVIQGWIKFNPSPSGDLFGHLRWIKPPLAQDKYYPNGFTADISLFGSSYTPATPDKTADVLNGVVRGGNATELLLDPAKLKLSLAPATGLLSGSFIHPQTGKPVNFKGALLQKQNWRSGYFLGPGESGYIFFGAAP